MDSRKLVSWGIPSAVIVFLIGYFTGDLRWALKVVAVMVILYSVSLGLSWAASRGGRRRNRAAGSRVESSGLEQLPNR